MTELDAHCVIVVEHSKVNCNGSLYNLEEHLTTEDVMFWAYIGIYVGLVLMAGMLSGLSLGLLSIDQTTLRVLKDAGKPKERIYAARIMPLIERHHLLLVTLLLANSICVEAMPIFLDKVSDPFIAVMVSVTAVLIFGEVLPQAVCTRFGLAIGATFAPFVYLLMGLLFIITFPLAKLLDCLLGKGHGTFYRRAELKALVALHGSLNNRDDQADKANKSNDHTVPTEDQLTTDEILIIKGVLDMKDKTVRHAMIPVTKVFMVSIEDKLDEETMTKILDSSYSRVPVYEGSLHKVVGILMVKSLIKLNTSQPVPVRELVSGTSRALRPPHFVPDNMSLFDLLNHFQTGKNHLSIVYMSERQPAAATTSGRAPSPLPDEILRGLVIGIITLEDIIEELLQEEILDETDLYMTDFPKLVGMAIAKTVRGGGGRDPGGGVSPRLLKKAELNETQESNGTVTYGATLKPPSARPLMESDSLVVHTLMPPA